MLTLLDPLPISADMWLKAEDQASALSCTLLGVKQTDNPSPNSRNPTCVIPQQQRR